MRTYIIDGVKVYQFVWNVLDANTFVLEDNDSILIIDPVDNGELFKFVRRYSKALIFLTHSHFDHICGLNSIREIIPFTTVISSKTCSENIQNARKNLSAIANALMAFHEHRETIFDEIEPFTCSESDIAYSGETNIQWEGHVIKLQEFAGHSNDSSCIIIDSKYLFSGDVILPIPTVTRLPGGSTKVFLEEDIPRLREIQNSIRTVFPGHGLPGRLEDMIAVNV